MAITRQQDRYSHDFPTSDGTNPASIVLIGTNTDTVPIGPGVGAGNIPIKAPGAANITTGQVALSTSAAIISPASATQRIVTIRNLDGTISIYIGPTGVTSGTGMLLKAGESMAVNTVAAVYGVAASGTPTAAYLGEAD